VPTEFWIAVATTLAVVGLELWDRFKTPLNWWRTIRAPIAGALALAWAIVVFRKTDKPAPFRERFTPKVYDDAAALQLVKDAADLDLEADQDKLEADDAADAVADRDDRVDARDKLLTELGGAATSDPE
jgi:hypothetical protein